MRWNNLTPREREAAKLGASGLDTRQMAQRMGVTAGTVRQYLHRVYGKAGVETQGARDRETLARESQK
jgi:DNA-binding CsgD family transcriptional regulator